MLALAPAPNRYEAGAVQPETQHVAWIAIHAAAYGGWEWRRAQPPWLATARRQPPALLPPKRTLSSEYGRQAPVQTKPSSITNISSVDTVMHAASAETHQQVVETQPDGPPQRDWRKQAKHQPESGSEHTEDE